MKGSCEVGDVSGENLKLLETAVQYLFKIVMDEMGGAQEQKESVASCRTLANADLTKAETWRNWKENMR